MGVLVLFLVSVVVIALNLFATGDTRKAQVATLPTTKPTDPQDKVEPKTPSPTKATKLESVGGDLLKTEASVDERSRGNFIKEWETHIASLKEVVKKAETSMGIAQASAAEADKELDKLRTKWGSSSDRTVQKLIKEKKDAADIANESMKNAALVLETAKGQLADSDKNSPATVSGNPLPAQRLVDWGKCFDAAAVTTWGESLRPIPATVVDKGILRAVPYKSFRAGDYEVNIYGDPDKPACIEVGIHNGTLENVKARRECITFMASVLASDYDRQILRTVNWVEDLKKFCGLTFEVTPPTAKDAYGAWWISVYDEAELDRSRASQTELGALSVSKSDLKAAAGNNSWTTNDLKDARVVAGGAGKTVYVKDYVRKDGTYVHGYSRSAPSRSGGRK